MPFDVYKKHLVIEVRTKLYTCYIDARVLYDENVLEF